MFIETNWITTLLNLKSVQRCHRPPMAADIRQHPAVRPARDLQHRQAG